MMVRVEIVTLTDRFLAQISDEDCDVMTVYFIENHIYIYPIYKYHSYQQRQSSFLIDRFFIGFPFEHHLVGRKKPKWKGVFFGRKRNIKILTYDVMRGANEIFTVVVVVSMSRGSARHLWEDT